MTSLRDLPSVDELLLQADFLIEEYGRPLTRDAIRATLDEIRTQFKARPDGELPDGEGILARANSQLSLWTASTLRPVINATGVILHTNLGRAPLSAAAIRAMQQVSENYSTLEYDLAKGQRGSRSVHAEGI